jgi:hypothetical protein
MLEIRGHFDGTQVLFDEPYKLEPNTKLIIKVVEDNEDNGREEWRILAKQSLARAYSDDEPEYGLDSIKEFNPEYEGS